MLVQPPGQGRERGLHGQLLGGGEQVRDAVDEREGDDVRSRDHAKARAAAGEKPRRRHARGVRQLLDRRILCRVPDR